MKQTILIITICLGFTAIAFTQNADEATIRQLDALEASAFLKNDSTTLEKQIWSKDLVVTNPLNNIVTIKDIKALMRNQKITQIPFKRTIEKITFNNNLAIVMGIEIPDISKAAVGVPPYVTKPRRITNIWSKTADGWRLTARQATNFLEMPNPQQDKEAEIRRLETLEREAVLKVDSVALFDKIWSPNMVVNAPANRVGTVEGTKMALRTGNLKYASFERTIEKITFNDNLAIVMGEEKLKPQGTQENAGKVVTRRFTNIWKFSNNNWSIIARQATIIKVE